MLDSVSPDKKQSMMECPVDMVKVDENRVRVVAFFALLFALFYLIDGNLLSIGILLIDFLLRAFNLNAYSPLVLISVAVVKQLGLAIKPVDRAPKRFAALMGLAFLSLILIAALAHYILLSKAIAAILIVFASLESFAGFCAGCYVYTFLNSFRLAYRTK